MKHFRPVEAFLPGPSDGASELGTLDIAAPAEQWGLSTTGYIILLLAVGIPFVAVLQVLSSLGQLYPGLVFGGLVLAILVVWRPELGLFVMAALVFWQYQTRLSTSFTLVKAGGIVVAAFGLLHALRSHGKPWPTMMKFAFAMAVWGTVSTLLGFILSSTDDLNTPYWYRFVQLSGLLGSIFFMYLLCRFCSTPAVFRVLLIVVVVSAAGEAAWGLIHPFEPERAIQEGQEAERLTTSEDINVNHYARLMIPGILLAPVLIARTRRLLWRLLLLGVIAICLAAAILTVSRGAIIGIALGGLVMIPTLKGLRPSTKALIVFLSLLVVGSALLLSSHYNVGEGWGARTSSSSLSEAFGGRLARWVIAARGAMDSPILGVGVGMEPVAYMRMGFEATESHNDLMSALITMGLPGLICYVGVVLTGLTGIWRLPVCIERSALLGLWVAMVVASLFNPTLTNKIFWMPAGICAAGIALLSQSRVESPPGLGFSARSPQTVPTGS